MRRWRRKVQAGGTEQFVLDAVVATDWQQSGPRGAQKHASDSELMVGKNKVMVKTGGLFLHYTKEKYDGQFAGTLALVHLHSLQLVGQMTADSELQLHVKET